MTARTLPSMSAEHQAQALCVTRPDVDFFPEQLHNASWRERHAQIAPAKAVCDECPVKEPCLDAALATPEVHDHGIAGGTTRRERIRLRKARR